MNIEIIRSRGFSKIKISQDMLYIRRNLEELSERCTSQINSMRVPKSLQDDRIFKVVDRE